MSCLLAIESSSEACSVALSREGECIQKAFHEPRKHAELLLPTVREVLSEAGIGLGDLDAIAFGRGPGSFTSLRIGIGVVQGLAWGAELGVVPVSSLAALAQGVCVTQALETGALIIVGMDARMEEVFHAQYRVGDSGLVELQGNEHVGPPAAVNFPGLQTLTCAGNGFERYPELTLNMPDDAVAYPDTWPLARDVNRLAEAWLLDNDPLPAHQAQPHYIRDDVAAKPA